MLAATIAVSRVLRLLATAMRQRKVAIPKNPHRAAFCTVPKKKSGPTTESDGKAPFSIPSPLISENKYSTKELEETVVNEKQLCGRTSFYAYIKELKLKGRIGYAEIDERTILVNTDSQQTLKRSVNDLDRRMD